MNNTIALDVRDFSVHFQTSSGVAKAVNHVTYAVRQGERLGLVGESGCGKTTTILGIMRLIKYPGRIVGGEVILNGERDLVRVRESQMRRIRHQEVAMIPQGAMNSLNPVKRIEQQFTEIFDVHGLHFANRVKRLDRIKELLSFVGVRADTVNMYPHELSGGMKQRVWIALAIALSPSVILADEPTSALDVVVQRRVMATLEEVQSRLGVALILIGHDMGLMAQFVDTVAVMYAGRIIEKGQVRDIFHEPLHPYTKFLIQSLPTLEKKKLFNGLEGSAPSLLDPPLGCPFHPRCPLADAAKGCFQIPPSLVDLGRERQVACYVVTEGRA